VSNIKPVLPLAAAFVSHGWSRYQFAEKGGVKCSVSEPGATAWDLTGALLAAAEELELLEGWADIDKLMRRVLTEAFPRDEAPGPIGFNMFTAKDARSVLALIATAYATE
jgi:hypothetical protein